MTGLTHLNALEFSLFNEEQRLKAATNPQEIELRKVWVSQYEKEIEAEKKFLGFDDNDDSELLDINELLEALA
jgi:hypothetical protein